MSSRRCLNAQRLPCLSWLDQANRRFPTSLSAFLEEEAELQETFLWMTKELILLKTIKSFSEIAAGELELQQKYNPERVSNPLCDSAKDLLHDSLRKGIAQLLERQNKPLPERMTHYDLVEKLIDTQVVDQFIVEPQDLLRIYDLLEDLILYDVHSSCFRTVLTILNVN